MQNQFSTTSTKKPFFSHNTKYFKTKFFSKAMLNIISHDGCRIQTSITTNKKQVFLLFLNSIILFISHGTITPIIFMSFLPLNSYASVIGLSKIALGSRSHYRRKGDSEILRWCKVFHLVTYFLQHSSMAKYIPRQQRCSAGIMR